jgi:hypothetical protein
MSNTIYDEYTEQFSSYSSSNNTIIEEHNEIPFTKEAFYDNTKFIPENNKDLAMSYNAAELAGNGIDLFGASIVLATFIAAVVNINFS